MTCVLSAMFDVLRASSTNNSVVWQSILKTCDNFRTTLYQLLEAWILQQRARKNKNKLVNYRWNYFLIADIHARCLLNLLTVYTCIFLRQNVFSHRSFTSFADKTTMKTFDKTQAYSLKIHLRQKIDIVSSLLNIRDQHCLLIFLLQSLW